MQWEYVDIIIYVYNIIYILIFMIESDTFNIYSHTYLSVRRVGHDEREFFNMT